MLKTFMLSDLCGFCYTNDPEALLSAAKYQVVPIDGSKEGPNVSRYTNSSIVTVARAMRTASEGGRMAAGVINGGDNIIEQERNKKRTDERRCQLRSANRKRLSR